MTLPLVLLPGMMCDARLFGPQMAALAGPRALHCLPITEHDTVEALAKDVLAAAPKRFALAGLSMGGIVAMEVLRQAPERVDRLALLDTNHKAEMPFVQSNRRPQMEKARQGKLVEVMRDEMKPNYLAEGPRRAEILDVCMDMALSLGPEVFVRQSLALRDRPDQSETLSAYEGRTLILCGAEDKLCTISRHEAMKALMPHATLAVIAGAGHLPTLEQPEKTSDTLAYWLKENTDG